MESHAEGGSFVKLCSVILKNSAFYVTLCSFYFPS